MQAYQVFGLCLLIATTVVALELKFQDCGSTGIKIKSFDVSPCETDPCVLHPGRNYTTKVTFTALINSTTITNRVVIRAFGRRYRLPVPRNGCSFIKCPLVAGQEQTVVTALPVDPSLPSMDIVLKWKLFGDDWTRLFCVALHYKINKNQ